MTLQLYTNSSSLIICADKFLMESNLHWSHDLLYLFLQSKYTSLTVWYYCCSCYFSSHIFIFKLKIWRFNYKKIKIKLFLNQANWLVIFLIPCNIRHLMVSFISNEAHDMKGTFDISHFYWISLSLRKGLDLNDTTRWSNIGSLIV